MNPKRNPLTIVGALFLAAAAAWPVLVSALLALTISPYERLARSAWCGSAAASGVLLGHCAICWEGTAAFALTGALLLSLGQTQGARASQISQTK